MPTVIFALKPSRFMASTTKAAARNGVLAPLDEGVVPWLILVALATLAPHAFHLPLWLSLLAATLLLWRAVLWFRSAPPPARWLPGLLVVAGTLGIALQFRTLFGRDAGVALLVLLMALKPMETRSRRDALVIVMLGFFLLLTHYFYSQSIPTGLWLLCAVGGLTATLIRLHGGEQATGDIFRQTRTLMAQAIPFLCVAFLLFPRVTGPLWGLPQDAYAGMTGLSERMAPGSLNRLIQSGAIAFRVQFSGPVPEPALLYWRGPVLDAFDGQTWTPQRMARPIQPPVITASGPAYAYKTTLEAHNQRWLLALDLPVVLPEGATLGTTLVALNREPIRSRMRTDFQSAPLYSANRQEHPAVLRQSLQLPAGFNPQSRQLAATWRSERSTPQAISQAALDYFRQEPFHYTLRPPLLGHHGIDDFLFSSRRGFCEHFAAAYVFLMRAAGIPARVVTGYQGGEINPVDGYLTVRQSDAHAWAEIWLADKGWLRIDPTAAVAPARIERGIEAALPAGDPLPALVRINQDWLRSLRNRWEAMNNAWNQWVLGYTPQRQRELLSSLGFSAPDWQTLISVLAALSATGFLILLAWSLYVRPAHTPAQRLWQDFCKKLARHGLVRAAWEGPLAFAERVARERPQLAALTRKAARHFVALHYAPGSTKHDEENLCQLRQCLRLLPRP